MENAMNGTQRRRKLLDMMRQASAPLSGGALGRETGVSRQVVVQDIALLRTMGYPILSTARGYVLNVSKHASRFLRSATPMSRQRMNWSPSWTWAGPWWMSWSITGYTEKCQPLSTSRTAATYSCS